MSKKLTLNQIFLTKMAKINPYKKLATHKNQPTPKSSSPKNQPIQRAFNTSICNSKNLTPKNHDY
jgi:hypothetical protein